MKKEFMVHGTLGDCFISCLKLRKEKSVKIFHKIEQTYWKPQIKEIYDLVLPQAEIEFVDKYRDDLVEITSDCHTQNMEFFPNIPVIKAIYPVDIPYIIIQAHSGKPDGGNTKRLSYEIIYKFIDHFDPVKVVLIGTNNFYSEVKKCRNLIGYTDISGIYNIIRNSNGFIGGEGLVSFMALSQRKDCIIFYREYEAIKKRIIGTSWEEYILDFIRMDNVFY